MGTLATKIIMDDPIGLARLFRERAEGERDQSVSAQTQRDKRIHSAKSVTWDDAARAVEQTEIRFGVMTETIRQNAIYIFAHHTEHVSKLPVSYSDAVYELAYRVMEAQPDADDLYNFDNVPPCPACDGNGTIGDFPCGHCKGTSLDPNFSKPEDEV